MSSHFAFQQLRKALDASQGHADGSVRERAAQRAKDWQGTLEGMASGRITVGSREPVTDYPAWVTLDVNLGGFASGQAAAAYLDFDDRARWEELVGEHPSKRDRRDGAVFRDESWQQELRSRLFAHYVSDAGLQELDAMLDTGAFEACIPEDTALLTVAWLLRAGDTEGAVQVIDAILPFASKLRFAPRSAPPANDRNPIGLAWRNTVADARDALKNIRACPDLEVQRTVFSVWNPLADRFLALWYPRLKPETRLDAEPFDEGWIQDARALIAEYEHARKIHGAPSRRNRNLQWLVDAAQEALHASKLSDRNNGRVRLAVDGMVRKRGAPGSESLAALRRHQAGIAAKPSSRTLGKIVAARFAGVHSHEGVQDPERYVGPITPAEAEKNHVPANFPLYPRLVTIVRRTHAAPLPTLLAEKIIPSAEIYAGLLPNEIAGVVAASYTDEKLGRVMAANYTGFSQRRSLLLLNYAHQVRVSELPWVMAADKHRVRAVTDATTAVLVRAAENVMTHWPGTIVPNPFVSQLQNLATAAGLEAPLVEEVAADIFMGDFTPKYTRAAAIAADMVEGTVYAKYYAIDKGAVLAVLAPEEEEHKDTDSKEDRPILGSLCRNRVAAMSLPELTNPWSVVKSGEIIEQSQILTTHNLATLVSLGAKADWYALAASAWATTKKLLRDAKSKPHPLGTIKNAAYAWRQCLFFLSMAEKKGGDAVVRRFIGEARQGVPPSAAESTIEKTTTDASTRSNPRYDLILNGLEDVAHGHIPHDLQTTPHGRIFLGWSRGPHWVFMDDRTIKAARRKRGTEQVVAASSAGEVEGDIGAAKWEAKLKALYPGWNPAV